MSKSRNPPVLTLIAGPNGSGKSTIVSGLRKVADMGVLVNADQIAASIAARKGESRPSTETQWEAAVVAEEMRWELLAQQVSFSTETVMSDGDRWLRFIAAAKQQGYYVMLLFVTTMDEAINVQRVAERILAGGHAVDPGKIVSRYRKSSCETGALAVVKFKDGRPRRLVTSNQMPIWAKQLLR